ncbi:MAG: hypothetical protein NVSMB3_11570 [Acidobacteriaceae bacterium]
MLRPQGRKGEILAELHTDFPDRFEPGAKIFLAAPGFSGDADQAVSQEIASSWLPHGRNAGRIVLGLRGIDSIEAAEPLAWLEVVVPETERLELDDGGVYIDDLIGCTLFDGEDAVGLVSDVQFMMSPDGKRRLNDPTPLLTVDMPAGEALIPFAQEFLVTLDLPRKRILMSLPRGLLELNLAKGKSSSLEAEGETE